MSIQHIYIYNMRHCTHEVKKKKQTNDCEVHAIFFIYKKNYNFVKAVEKIIIIIKLFKNKIKIVASPIGTPR